jgi:hypothetical protein
MMMKISDKEENVDCITMVVKTTMADNADDDANHDNEKNLMVMKILKQ